MVWAGIYLLHQSRVSGDARSNFRPGCASSAAGRLSAIASGGLVVPRQRAVETRRQDKSDVTAVGYACSCLTKRLHQSDEGIRCDRGQCHFGHQSGVGDQVWSNLRPKAPAPLLVGFHSHQKLGPSGAQTTSREQRGTSHTGVKESDEIILSNLSASSSDRLAISMKK